MTNIRVPIDVPARLDDGFERIRRELRLPGEFPKAVLEEADWVASVPRFGGKDLTDLPFVTIDPPGSMDLDQAIHLERLRGGYRVWYAIADVGAFVRPGGAIDAEARSRGETVYMPDGRVPLHPTVLSEGAASLLPGVTRPGRGVARRPRRGGPHGRRRRDSGRLVRSRERLDYDYVQAAVDTGTADGTLAPAGRDRQAAAGARTRARRRHPAHPRAGGRARTADGYRLEYRVPLPAEAWNAQISLLTGMAAASMMLDAEIGVLRVLPPAALRRPRPRCAGWPRRWACRGPRAPPTATSCTTWIRRTPQQAAFLHESRVLLRGAGYVAFNGEPPRLAEHAAVAAPYAHVTAPLRRLVDRYATEVCLAIAAGEPVPEDVQEALAGLPDIMAATGRRADAVERACVDLVEAFVLRDRVGQAFDAVVIDVDEHRVGGQVQLADPAVIARCDGDRLPLGEQVRYG